MQRRSLFMCWLLASGVLEGAAQEGEARNAGLSHWVLHGSGKHQEAAGNSWYTRAFDFLDTGYALRGFQVGLGSAWLLPDGEFDKSKCPCAAPGITEWCSTECPARGGCADLFETMEGGLGYWRNELPSPHVKWRLNNVNGCYANQIMGSLFHFYGTNLKCEEMGFVMVNNRLIMAPDGIGFQNGPDYGMLGQAFVRSTLGRTGTLSTKDDFTYLVVLDAANFKGPVGYTLEAFWRDFKGYPEAPDFAKGGVLLGATGFEFNGLSALTSSGHGRSFLKIPRVQFPVTNGKTAVLAGVRGWGTDALQTPLEAALNGARLPKGPMLALAKGANFGCHQRSGPPVALGFQGFPLIDLGGNMSTTEYSGECVSEITWDPRRSTCRGGQCAVPELWELKPGSGAGAQRLEPTTPQALPQWSSLASRRFPQKTYADVKPLKGRGHASRAPGRLGRRCIVPGRWGAASWAGGGTSSWTSLRCRGTG